MITLVSPLPMLILACMRDAPVGLRFAPVALAGGNTNAYLFVVIVIFIVIIFFTIINVIVYIINDAPSICFSRSIYPSLFHIKKHEWVITFIIS